MPYTQSTLRHALTARGIRPAELARRLNVTRQSVHGWLTRTNSPRVDTLTRIAQALAIPLPDLIAGAFPDNAEPPAKTTSARDHDSTG